jgi:glucose/arabinose dehydrogenase
MSSRNKQIAAWVIAAALATAVAGCAGAAQPSAQSQAPAPAPVPAKSAPAQPAPVQTPPPATTPLTAAEAVTILSQAPEVVQHRKEVEAAGRRQVLKVENETPTKFVVRVAEDAGTHVATTFWFGVMKSDRSVVKLDIADPESFDK